MGSLDDAIREHLELKRHRGATDDEVKRQEEGGLRRGRRPAPPSRLPSLSLRSTRPRPRALRRRGAGRRRAGAERSARPRKGTADFSSSPSHPQPDEVSAEEVLRRGVTHGARRTGY